MDVKKDILKRLSAHIQAFEGAGPHLGQQFIKWSISSREL